MDDLSNNGNTRGGEPFVTVSDLAAQLDVSLPRLMRLVKREPFAARTEQQQRQTKTGTRTVTVVSVSVIPDIEAALREGTAPKPEHKHKRYEGEPSEVLPDEDTRVRALVGMMMQQAEARIKEQEATIKDLRQDKNEWKQEREHLRAQVEALTLENAELKAIPAGPTEIQNGMQERTSDTHSGDTGEQARVDAPTAETATMPDISREIKRPWWQFWKGGE